MSEAGSGFDYETLDIRCDHQGDYVNGEYMGCSEPGMYHVWWLHLDRPNGYVDDVIFCEAHWADAYKAEYGEYPPGYVDKNARIAALEAENAALKQDAEEGRAIREYLDSGAYEVELRIVHYADEEGQARSISVHTLVDGVSMRSGCDSTLRAALDAAGLLKEEVA